MHCSRKHSLNKKKRWPEKHCCMNVAHCCWAMCVWWRWLCSHWRWVWLTSSIRSVAGVWTAALPWYWDHLIQTFPNSHLLSISTRLLNLKRELKYCKCNTLLSKDQSLRCSAWQQSHCCGPSFLEQPRHVCPPSLQITSLAVGTLVRLRHRRCLILKRRTVSFVADVCIQLNENRFSFLAAHWIVITTVDQSFSHITQTYHTKISRACQGVWLFTAVGRVQIVP